MTSNVNFNVMMSRLVFGILVIISLSSCDKIQSLSTKKTIEEKANDSLNVKSYVVYDESNPDATVSSLDNLIKKNKEGFDIYIDKNSPKFSTKDCFYPYIKMEEDGAKLYLKVQHVDVDLLEINSFIITADKIDYTINGEVTKRLLNGKKEYYIETLDKLISSYQDLKTLEAIANGEYVKTILVGENRFIKKDISEKMKKSFHNVLLAYVYLNKK